VQHEAPTSAIETIIGMEHGVERYDRRPAHGKWWTFKNGVHHKTRGFHSNESLCPIYVCGSRLSSRCPMVGWGRWPFGAKAGKGISDNFSLKGGSVSDQANFVRQDLDKRSGKWQDAWSCSASHQQWQATCPLQGLRWGASILLVLK